MFLHIDPTGLLRASIEGLGDTHTFFLLGLMHGHFDDMSTHSNSEEMLIDDSFGRNSVNVGIAVVVPASKILEVLNQPSDIKRRKAIEYEMKRGFMPTPD